MHAITTQQEIILDIPKFWDETDFDELDKKLGLFDSKRYQGVRQFKEGSDQLYLSYQLDYGSAAKNIKYVDGRVVEDTKTRHNDKFDKVKKTGTPIRYEYEAWHDFKEITGLNEYYYKYYTDPALIRGLDARIFKIPKGANKILYKMVAIYLVDLKGDSEFKRISMRIRRTLPGFQFNEKIRQNIIQAMEKRANKTPKYRKPQSGGKNQDRLVLLKLNNQRERLKDKEESHVFHDIEYHIQRECPDNNIEIADMKWRQNRFLMVEPERTFELAATYP